MRHLLAYLLLTPFILNASSDIDLLNKTAAATAIDFTENKGQISDQFYKPRPDVLFSGEAGGLTFHIRDNGVSYQTSRIDSWKLEDKDAPGMKQEGEELDSVPNKMTTYRTDINWLNFNKDYSIVKGEAKEGYNNYYLASCPDGALNVKSYSDVTFKGLYDGVDLKWYDNNGELEYDYIVSPNADYRDISWEIKGADRISIGEDGQLIIETPLGNIEEQAPVAYQGLVEIEAKWSINGDVISFLLGEYDTNETLIIDPVVRQWGTYYGGSSQDFARPVASDAAGNIYMSGETNSTTGIATTGSHQITYGGGNYDCFLVKFNPSGVRQWGTYYGGTGEDRAYSVSTDGAGNIYMSGYTSSTTGIATTGSHQITYGGGIFDPFLVKFNPSGVRQWGTYYGGTGYDYVYSVSTDAAGNIYMSGLTRSTSGIATTGSHQITYGGGLNDCFLVKFNPSGVRQWGTYYGGTGDDRAHSVSTDGAGNIYMSGETNSTTGIATTGSHQITYGGGISDAFLVKFNPSGVRQWGTYYGGTGNNRARSVSTDGAGNIYMSGYTSSTTGIATTGSHQITYGGGGDCFLVKFNSSGVRQWGTYYGGTGYDYVYSVSTDAAGNIYMSGLTRSTSGIATTGSHQITYGGGLNDCFLVKFNPSGVRQWGTYYGGTGDDRAHSVSTDGAGNIYMSGETNSTTGIATTSAHQNFSGGLYDCFLVKFQNCPVVFSQTSFTSCNSYTWAANSQTYTSTGNYTTTLTNALGCDSVVTLALTINNSSSSQVSGSFCQGNTYTTGGGQIVSSPGQYIDTISTTAGCDSIIITNLSQINASYDSLIINTCGPILSLSGKTFNSTGTYLDTIPNNAGCDSIVYYNLTVNPLNNSVSLQNNQLVSGEANASYQWLACSFNYAAVPNATSQTFSPPANGTYAVEVTRGACKDTSSCYLFLSVGIDEVTNSSNSITIYPNPNEGDFYVDFEQNLTSDFTAEIYSITGAKITTHLFNKGSNRFRIENSDVLESGSYIIRVVSDETVMVKRFVVQ